MGGLGGGGGRGMIPGPQQVMLLNCLTASSCFVTSLSTYFASVCARAAWSTVHVPLRERFIPVSCLFLHLCALVSRTKDETIAHIVLKTGHSHSNGSDPRGWLTNVCLVTGGGKEEKVRGSLQVHVDGEEAPHCRGSWLWGEYRKLFMAFVALSGILIVRLVQEAMLSGILIMRLMQEVVCGIVRNPDCEFSTGSCLWLLSHCQESWLWG